MGGVCSTYGGVERYLEGMVKKPEGKRTLAMTRSRWEIILRWTFWKYDVGVWTRSIWLRIGTSGGHF